MRCYRVFMVLVLVAGLSGCHSAIKQTSIVQQPPLPEIFTGDSIQGSKPWTDKDFQNDPDHFQFVIVSDLHGDGVAGIFEEAVKRINLLQPEFVVCVGDLIQGYSEDEREIKRQQEEFEQFIKPLDMRFFYLPGNHDITNLTMEKAWKHRYGATYYHFVYRNVLFLCLNTEDPPPSQISEAQMDYVRNVLAKNAKVRWTVVLMHKPMWTENPLAWAPLETMLGDRPHTVFAGHIHSYDKSERNGKKYIRLAVTGGGSGARGPAHGEFNQIAWVTMTETGPEIANLDLKGILDEDLSTEPLTMIEAMSGKTWFKADALVSKSKKFKKGRALLHFSNPGALPLDISCSFTPHDQLTVSEPDIHVALPPESEKQVALEVKTRKPLLLSEIDPLEYDVSAVYTTSGGVPMKSDAVGALDLRYKWQGLQRIQNRSFSRGLDHWVIRKKTPQSAEFKVDEGSVRVNVLQKDMLFAMVLAQPLGELKTGTDYQLAVKAKSMKGPVQIGMGLRDGNGYAPLLIDGKTEPRHLISLTDSMERHEVNFRIAKETDVPSGIIVFSFLSENEVIVEDVSLRAVDQKKSP